MANKTIPTIQTNEGNVGIGITNPATLLHVDTAGADARIRVSAGANTVQGGMIANTGTSLVYAGSVTNHGFSLRTNDTDRVRIDTNGNVGIGVTNPRVLLDLAKANNVAQVLLLGEVGANIRVGFGLDPSNAVMRIFSYNQITDGGIEFGGISSDGSTWTRNHRLGLAAGNSFFNQQGGNVGIGVTNPDLRLHIDASNAYPAAAGANTSGFLTLRAKTASASHGMYMGVADASPWGSWIQCGDSVNSAVNYPLLLNPNGGNVGIGLRNPATSLDIAGSLRVTGIGQIGPVGGYGFGLFNAGTNTFAGQLYGRANGIQFTDNIGGNTVYIASGGNVGIGTTNPATKLHVYGAGGGFEFGVGSSNCYIEAIDRAATAAFINTSYYTRGTGYFAWNNGSYTERMRIDGAGRVGIGTTIAIAQLHVTGQTYLTNVVANVARNQLTINTNGANYAHFYDAGVAANNALSIGGNGAIATVPTKAIMTWRLSTENVGIGLTNPEAASALHIQNTSAVAKVTIESADASESFINFSAQSSEYSVGFVRDGSNVNSLRFCAADGLSTNEVMRLQNTNVGIGVTNPTKRLHVVGSLYWDYNGTAAEERAVGIQRTVAAANGAFTEIGSLAASASSIRATFEIFHHDSSTIEYSLFELIANYYTGTTTDWVQLPSRTQAHYAGDRNGVVVDARLASTGGSVELRLRSIGGAGGAMIVNVRIKSNTNLTETSATGTGATVAGLLGFNRYEFPVTDNRFKATTEGLFILNNGNIGIGTTNPVQKFQVDGVVGNPALGGTTQTGIARISNSTDNATLDFGIRAAGAGAWIQSTDETDLSAYYPLLLNPNGGNVGIGITNSSALFHVFSIAGRYINFTPTSVSGLLVQRNQSIASQGTTVLTLVNGQGAELGVERGTSLNLDIGYGGTSTTTAGTIARGARIAALNYNVYDATAANQNASLVFYTATGGSLTEKTRITADGKVGIGTATPTTLLSVGGAGSTLPASGITFGGDSVANIYRSLASQLKTDGSFVVTNTLTVLGGDLGIRILKNGSDSISSNLYIANAANTRAYNFQPNAAGTNLALWTYNSANAWQNSVNFNYNGSVGIGTTTPSGKLHIVSTIAGETVLRTDGTNGTLFSVVDDLSDSLMSVNNSAGLPVLEVFADDRVVAGQYGSGDFVLINNKVGLGTSNPANKLTVIGGASIGSTTYNTSAPSNGLIVEGRVGIGSTSPNYYLDVYSPALDAGRFYNNQTACQLNLGSTNNTDYVNLIWYTSNGNAQFFKNRSSAGWGGTDSMNLYNSNGGFAFHANGVANSVNITTAGNVGINKDTPTTKLDVVGSFRVVGTTNVGGIFITGSSATQGNIRPAVSNGSVLISDDSGLSTRGLTVNNGGGATISTASTTYDILTLQTAGTVTHSFNKDGNVGIGATNPNSARLHIKGDGTAPIIRVETAKLESAAGGTAGRTLKGWLPIITGANASTDTVYIPLFGPYSAP